MPSPQYKTPIAIAGKRWVLRRGRPPVIIKLWPSNFYGQKIDKMELSYPSWLWYGRCVFAQADKNHYHKDNENAGSPNRYNRLDCQFCVKSGMPIRGIFPPANTQTIPAIKSRYMGNYFFHNIILLIYALFNLQQQKNNTDAHESMTNSCNPGNRSVQSFT